MTATTRWRPLAAGGDETVLHRPSEPIFDELARRWSDTGRTVPGSIDHEWTALVGRSPWPKHLRSAPHQVDRREAESPGPHGTRPDRP